MEGLAAALRAMGFDGPGTTEDELWELGSRDAILEHLLELADERLEARAKEVGEDDWATVERLVLLRTIDSLWVEHLTEIDDMRRGIGLRGYAQQDPLNEFRKEAFRLYEELRGADPPPGRDDDLPGQRDAPASSRVQPVGSRRGGERRRRRVCVGASTARRLARRTVDSTRLRSGIGWPLGSPIAGGLAAGPDGSSACARRVPGAPASGEAEAGLHADRGSGSAATTPAGADPARSTRSATAR